MIRTRSWTRLVAVGIGLLTVGCGSTAGSPTPTTTQTTSAPLESSSPSQALESELVVAAGGGTYGDALRTAYMIPFEADTGVKVIHDVPGNDITAELEAQEVAGNVEWDVTTGISTTLLSAARDKGLFQDIDWSKIGSAADTLLPGGKQPWGVGQEYTGWALAYNRSAFPTPPTKVSDFFDTAAFPGPRTVNNWGDPDITIMDALLADGVAPEDLTPFDLDRAFAKLDKIKTSITVYWETGNQLVSSLADKRVVMCLCIDGRALQAGQLNPDIEVAWDGGLRYVGYWVVPTNAPHPEAAHAFLKSTLDPDRGATFTSLIGYSGIVKGVYDLLTPERQKNVLINPKNLDKTYELTPDQVKWIGDHYDEINERWTTWVSQ